MDVSIFLHIRQRNLRLSLGIEFLSYLPYPTQEYDKKEGHGGRV